MEELQEYKSHLDEIKKKFAKDLMDIYANVEASIDDIKNDLKQWEAKKREIEAMFFKEFGYHIKPDLGRFPISLEPEIRRFWKEPEFPGWRRYVLLYIREVDSFLSLRNFLKHTQVTDKEERSALTSAISNALTVNYQTGQLGRITVDGANGMFYGLPYFFSGRTVKDGYAEDLAKRLSKRAIKFTQVDPPDFKVTEGLGRIGDIGEGEDPTFEKY